MQKNLSVYSEQTGINLVGIHHLVSELSKELKFKIRELDIVFTGSDQIKKINKKYLNHNYSTDILTFDYSDKFKEIEGEIIISVDDAKKNATKFKVSFEEEITRLIVHGILHINGYNDNTAKNKLKMKIVENKLLNRFKFILLKGR